MRLWEFSLLIELGRAGLAGWRRMDTDSVAGRVLASDGGVVPFSMYCRLRWVLAYFLWVSSLPHGHVYYTA